MKQRTNNWKRCKWLWGVALVAMLMGLPGCGEDGNTPFITNPTAEITAPANNQVYNYGESITFTGTGYDYLNKAIDDQNLTWTSSLDGQLGTGTSVTSANLSWGSHTITLSATDAYGKTATDTVTIIVGSATSAQQGRFVDSPVQGLEFASGTITGVTDANGTFHYEAGQSITFSIGDITIGTSSNPKSILTPLDLVDDAVDYTHATVTHIAQFLQSLDVNGDPSDGITISDAVRANAVGLSLDFSADSTQFETQAQTVLAQLFPESAPVLVSAAQAQSNLYNGLRSLVSTTRDSQGIWFISGEENIYAIYEAMGYAVAQDRLWQAEVYRRTARGKLAEILGPGDVDESGVGSFVKTDIFMRTIGYSDAELLAAYQAMDKEAKTIVKAYVDGLNRRIAEVRADRSLMPFEFKILSALGQTDIVPPDWTIEDLLAWNVIITRQFDGEGFSAQLQIQNASLYQNLAARFPQDFQDMFDDLRWTQDPDAQTYIPAENTAARMAPAVPETAPAVSPEALPDLSEVSKKMAKDQQQLTATLKKINAYVKLGSYGWVVSGSRTASGNPIIYSGPQMGHQVPSIIFEGSIRAGNIQVSGMTMTGFPAIIIGRTPHHAWALQTGHAHTADYYFESPDNVFLHRMETIKIAGGSEIEVPIFRSSHGPIINPLPYDPTTYTPSASNPIIAWKYTPWGREFNVPKSALEMARAKSVDEFGAVLKEINVSFHVEYADREGNIAYWMLGRDPVRPAGEWRLPQGAIPGVAPLEYDVNDRKPMPSDRNTSAGYYAGWNNKSSADSLNSFNSGAWQFGPFQRAHVIKEYFDTHDNFTFEQLRDLALNIATTDSDYYGSGGGNPWAFVGDIFSAVVEENPTDARSAALALMDEWDGHFVAGGPENWATGKDRADAWILMDTWLDEVLRLTFEDELGTDLYADEPKVVLFNVLLHGIPELGTALQNRYNWFQNLSDPSAPQTLDAIILQALDTALTNLGDRPWGIGQRGEIENNHDMFNTPPIDFNPIHTTPYSSRSTYAHVVEYGPNGPVRIESMFPLGESGTILMDLTGQPVYDENFFSMTEAYDNFMPRPFPLFE